MEIKIMKNENRNKFFSTLIIFIVLFSVSIPTVHATSFCGCYFKNGDCQEVFLPTIHEDTEGCKTLCASTSDTTAAEFGIDAESVTIASKCTIAHNKLLSTTAATEKAKTAPAGTTSTAPKTSIDPILNVPIPDLTFSKAIITPTTVKTSYLADYLNAIYKYLIGASFTFAVVMVMIGGFQYVLSSGGNSELQKKAKKRMTDAVTGLVLLLSVYFILFTVNPQMVLFKSIEIQNVPPEGLGNNEATDASDEDASYPSVSISPGQIPKFKQCDAKWSKSPYKGRSGSVVICGPNKHKNSDHEDNVCESGCGPTSTAVVLGYYGKNVSPPLVADFASEIGAHPSCSSGTNVGLLCKKVSSKWPDINCKSLSTKNTDALAKILTEKKPLVFSCHGCTGKLKDGSNKTYKGHYMVLIGVSGNSFTVFDVGRQNGIETIPISEFSSGKIASVYQFSPK